MEDLVETLVKMGTKGIHPQKSEDMEWINKTPIDVQHVPLNKVGDYCEGEDGNITLPIEYNYVNTLAILGSGVGIATATKIIWEAWGESAIKKTRMKLQLADVHQLVQTCAKCNVHPKLLYAT